MPQVTISKANGGKEPYNRDKLLKSIKRVGIPDKMADQVVDHIENLLYPGIPTGVIFEHILEFLHQTYPQGEARFNLKRGLMELGPSGYPFEKFMARVLEKLGYSTQVGVVLSGECISHEVDIVATKDNTKHMIECKFHNLPGSRSDVKVALYVKSRFEDLKHLGFSSAWIITNTKCTQDAVKYSMCKHIKIISWSYPQHDNLQEIIDSTNLFPVTCHPQLSLEQKKSLLLRNIVTLDDFYRLTPIELSDLKISAHLLSTKVY